jgi:membrane protein YqaA with SNARE-associated domain
LFFEESGVAAFYIPLLGNDRSDYLCISDTHSLRMYLREAAEILGSTCELAMTAIIEPLVETATGTVGLLLIFIYSVLVACVLPLPGELVLLPASQMELGVSPAASIAIVILVSAVGKAIGSVVAYRIGRGAVTARPSRWVLGRVVPRSGGSPVKGPLMSIIRKYEYIGLAVLLAIPLMPDTAVIYAFSIRNTNDERRFILAAFLGTVGRLLLTLALVTSALIVI